MAIVDLPDFPRPRRFGLKPRDFGGTMKGGLGGPDLRINWLGNRWIATITLPPMDIAIANEWSAKLTAAVQAEGVRWWVRQLGIEPGGAGNPVVSGAGQSGKSLTISGMTSGYVGRFNQYFSVVSAGRRCGHKLIVPFRADGSGNAVATIEPALRIEPADGDTIEFGKPYIEGLLTAVPEDVTDVSYLVDGFQITIEESE